MPTRLRVLTWNILAQIWAGPRHYPEAMPVEVLDRTQRHRLLNDRLRSMRDDFDVICLQEVMIADVDSLLDALGAEQWYAARASHRDGYWGHWLDEQARWEPNGTAVFVRQSLFANLDCRVATNAAYGNTSTLITATMRDGGTSIAVASVHFDADDAGRRAEECRALVGTIRDVHTDVAIVAGDFNADTSDASVAAVLAEASLVDALADVGNLDPTHPYARPADGFAQLARIDHIVTRGATAIEACVHDEGTWPLEIPAARIEALLRATGTDHLRVTCTLEVG